MGGDPICSFKSSSVNLIVQLEPKAAKPGVEVVGDKIMTGRSMRVWARCSYAGSLGGELIRPGLLAPYLFVYPTVLWHPDSVPGCWRVAEN